MCSDVRSLASRRPWRSLHLGVAFVTGEQRVAPETVSTLRFRQVSVTTRMCCFGEKLRNRWVNKLVSVPISMSPGLGPRGAIDVVMAEEVGGGVRGEAVSEGTYNGM